LEKYVKHDKRLPYMLKRLRENGAKTFLLTNSDYSYTYPIMAYLLDGAHEEMKSWLDYFGMGSYFCDIINMGQIL